MIFQHFATLKLWPNTVIMPMSLILFHLITNVLLILSHRQDEYLVIRYLQKGKKERLRRPTATAAIVVIVTLSLCVYL